MKAIRLFLVVWVLTGLVWAGAPKSVADETTHQHYSRAANYDQPGPDGSLAPRLLNLGKHAFPVTTKSGNAQLLVNQGINRKWSRGDQVQSCSIQARLGACPLK
jgi:hypothetical protein